MLFSQRMGITPLPSTIGPTDMPEALRNSLWNVFHPWLTSAVKMRIEGLWADYWKLPVDQIPTVSTYNGPHYAPAIEQVRARFFRFKWHEVYDLLQFCIENLDPSRSLMRAVDAILRRELAAYRIVDNLIVPVTDEQEIIALSAALVDKGRFAAAAEHLATALRHLSNRESPDYRNSIKESISAVESVAKIITGKEKAELGPALAELEKRNKLHGALKAGWSSLYGYTSDADGIRHALMNDSNLTADDAKYFLLACTSFVNYLKTLA